MPIYALLLLSSRAHHMAACCLSLSHTTSQHHLSPSQHSTQLFAPHCSSIAHRKQIHRSHTCPRAKSVDERCAAIEDAPRARAIVPDGVAKRAAARVGKFLLRVMAVDLDGARVDPPPFRDAPLADGTVAAAHLPCGWRARSEMMSLYARGASNDPRQVSGYVCRRAPHSPHSSRS